MNSRHGYVRLMMVKGQRGMCQNRDRSLLYSIGRRDPIRAEHAVREIALKHDLCQVVLHKESSSLCSVNR